MSLKDKIRKIDEREDPRFALGKINYILILIGFAIIVIGFLLMMGGKAENPAEFNPEIFSFRRITLAPIVILFGFFFEIFAIMYRPKKRDQSQA